MYKYHPFCSLERKHYYKTKAQTAYTYIASAIGGCEMTLV